MLGDLGVEVVLQHPQRRLLRPAEGVQLRAAIGALVFVTALLRSIRRVPPPSAAPRSGRAPPRRRCRARDSGRAPAPGRGCAAPSITRRDDGRRALAAHLDPARGGHELDREHTSEPVDGAAELARGAPAHRHVILLHGAGRDRVDGCRGRQALQLAHDAGLGVLGDHVPGVDPGVVGQERRSVRRCGSCRGTGRCAARSCSRRRPPRSRGSRARSRAVRRGSCRWIPGDRRA